jgi:hypothetical protein
MAVNLIQGEGIESIFQRTVYKNVSKKESLVTK